MIHKFANPKNDVAFKKIFGTEKNKDILIHFLNDIIDFKEHGFIVNVTFLDSVQDPESRSNKTSIVDILCEDQNGHGYIVEMQVAKEKGFEKRAQYYASKAYFSQAKNRGKYYNLKEIIFLAISDFEMFPNKKSYKSDHVILDLKSYENDLKDFSFTFLELPKFTKTIEQLENMTDKWLYFFKHAKEISPEELKDLIGKDFIIRRAFDELDTFYWNEKEILTYEQAEKYEGAYLASMEQKYDEGKEKGIVEGIIRGREEGRSEGIIIGREEGKSEGRAEGRAEGEKKVKLAIARTLLLLELEIQKIHEITGLSKEEIKLLPEAAGKI